MSEIRGWTTSHNIDAERQALRESKERLEARRGDALRRVALVAEAVFGEVRSTRLGAPLGLVDLTPRVPVHPGMDAPDTTSSVYRRRLGQFAWLLVRFAGDVEWIAWLASELRLNQAAVAAAVADWAVLMQRDNAETRRFAAKADAAWREVLASEGAFALSTTPEGSA